MRLQAARPVAIAVLAAWTWGTVVAQEDAAPEQAAPADAAPADTAAPADAAPAQAAPADAGPADGGPAAAPTDAAPTDAPLETPPQAAAEPPAPPPPPPPSTPATPYAVPTYVQSTAAVPKVPIPVNDAPPESPEIKRARKAAGIKALDAAKILYSTGMWVYSDLGGYISDEGPVECAQRCEDLDECSHWNWDCRNSECTFKGEAGFFEDGDPQFGRDYILTGESKRMPSGQRRLKSVADMPKEL